MLVSFLLFGHVEEVKLIFELLVDFQQQQLLVVNLRDILEHQSRPSILLNIGIDDFK